MIEDPRPLVFALAKLGLSHSAIAHSSKPLPQTPNNRPSPPEGFYVFNNDGEPNDGL
jgi:hypothetical protein